MNYEEYRAVMRYLTSLEEEVRQEEDEMRAAGNRTQARPRVRMGWLLQNKTSELSMAYPEFSLRYGHEIVDEILSKGTR